MSHEDNEPRITTRTKAKQDQKVRRLPPFHVVLLNDDHHTGEFVIDVLQKTLRFDEQKAILLMTEAHTKGRCIVWTGPKEVAELKVEQITSFHEIKPDGTKLGPLGVDLEPAPQS